MDLTILRAPLVYWTGRTPGGRTRIRIVVLANRPGRDRGRSARLPVRITPEGSQIREIRTVAVGFPHTKTPTALAAEAEVPPGRYRIFPEVLPAAAQRFEVTTDGSPPIRIFCRHPRDGSHADFLGAFSRKGAQIASLATFRVASCCRKDFPRGSARSPNTGSLGIIQALSLPVRLSIGGRGGREATVNPGGFLIVDPKITAPIADDSPFPLHFRQLVIETSALREFLRVYRFPERVPFAFTPVPRPPDPLLDASLLHLEDAMRAADDPGADACVQIALHQILLHLLRRHPGRLGTAWRRRADTPDRADTRLARAVRHLEANLSAPYDRAALARAACTSKQTLQRLFREHLHRTPTAYLQALRVARARSLLARDNLTLREAARAVGYRDARNFRRVFMRLVQTPVRLLRARR